MLSARPSPRWAEAVLIVDFDESHGQIVQHVYPQGTLPQKMVDDIKMIAMPDCLEAGERHEFTFQARVRNKEGTTPFEALNIYVYFKQRKSNATRRGYEQRSIVFVCRHYYTDLCNRILSRFADVIEALPMYQQMLADPNPTAARDALASATEVCFQHFRQWPEPTPGRALTLPFYGEMFEFIVPEVAPYILSPAATLSTASTGSRRPGDMFLGDGSGVLGDINLMSVLAPLGLLPHMWTLWELIISGQDVVVYSPSASICSAVVRALASLTSPLACCADMRCYINNYDSDTNLFASAADSKAFKLRGEAIANSSAENGYRTAFFTSTVTETQYTLLDSFHIGRSPPYPQCIIGITNPFLLRTFSKFQNAIFIPSDDASSPTTVSLIGSPAVSGIARLGISYLFGSPKEEESSTTQIQVPRVPPVASMSPPVPRHPPKLYRHAYGVAKATVASPPTLSLEVMYDQWCAIGGAGRSKAGKVASYGKGASKKTHVLLVLRCPPSVAADKSILHRLSQFSVGARDSLGWDGISFGGKNDFDDSDAIIVGSLLLREHFKMLTLTLLKPFDHFFSPIDYRNGVERSSNKSAKNEAPPTNCMTTKRVGAQYLWLYADSTTLFGLADPGEAIQTFLTFYQVGNLPPSLNVMGKARLEFFLNLFAKSSTLLLWVEWRRNVVVSQLCWSMVETSRDLTMEQLLSAFAVEQRKEYLMKSDLIMLIERVENTIANVRAINSVSSIPVTDDRILCDHMLVHLNSLNDLLQEQHADIGQRYIINSKCTSSCCENVYFK